MIIHLYMTYHNAYVYYDIYLLHSQEVVDTLLELAPEAMPLCFLTNSEGLAPLHCAARDGQEATARALLRGAPDGLQLLTMASKSSAQLRPLHFAAKNGHTEPVWWVEGPLGAREGRFMVDLGACKRWSSRGGAYSLPFLVFYYYYYYHLLLLVV